MAAPDPLDDARLLLQLARLILRSRRAAARVGVQPAAVAARDLVPIGERLAAAVAAAEQAETPEARAAALAEVVRAGEDLISSIQSRWEGIERLLSVLLSSIRQDPPPKMGQ